MNQNNQNTSVAETPANDPLSIHQRAIAIDMHADTAQRLLDEDVDLQHELSDGHFDAVRAKAGNLDAQFFSIWVEPQLFGGGGERAMKRADDQIAAVRALAEKHPETWLLATSADDIRRAAREGKIAALMGLEGGYAIDDRLENVQRYYDLGVRYMSPAWSVSTSWAGKNPLVNRLLFTGSHLNAAHAYLQKPSVLAKRQRTTVLCPVRNPFRERKL